MNFLYELLMSLRSSYLNYCIAAQSLWYGAASTNGTHSINKVDNFKKNYTGLLTTASFQETHYLYMTLTIIILNDINSALQICF